MGKCRARGGRSVNGKDHWNISRHFWSWRCAVLQYATFIQGQAADTERDAVQAHLASCLKIQLLFCSSVAFNLLHPGFICYCTSVKRSISNLIRENLSETHLHIKYPVWERFITLIVRQRRAFTLPQSCNSQGQSELFVKLHNSSKETANSQLTSGWLCNSYKRIKR